MPAIAGLRGTGDWGTDERPKNFREMILWRDPNGSAPMTALMARMRSEAVDDPEFNWWEEEQNPIRVQVNGVLTDAATTVVVDSGALNLVPGDVLLVETAIGTTYANEIIEVTAVTDDTTFTVTRGASGTTPIAGASSIPDNTFLTKIGNVFAEGTNSPNSATRNPTKFNNLCQIFKTSYELTKSTEKTKARTGDPLKNDKKRKMFDHSVALEKAFLFGKKYETTGGNGKPKRYTGGLLYFLAQAVAAGSTHCIKIWSATPTVDTFFDSVYKVWDYNPGGSTAGTERIVFAGNGFLNRLNKIARGDTGTRINYDGVVKAYGMKLMQFILPQGTLLIRTHPLMNVHSLFSSSAFVIDPSGIVYRYLRDTHPQDNIQANDADTHKGQWLSECGVEFHHLKCMQYHGAFDQ